VHGVKSKWGTEKARKMHIKKIRSAEGSECQENNSNLSTKAQVEIHMNLNPTKTRKLATKDHQQTE
jgi:hypothetical protein